MLKINQDETSMEAVGTTIGNIMQYRAERIVYVIAEPQAQYGDVAVLLDKLANSASETHLALLSGELRRSIYEQRIDISCELTWPRSEFNRFQP